MAIFTRLRDERGYAFAKIHEIGTDGADVLKDGGISDPSSLFLRLQFPCSTELISLFCSKNSLL